MPKMQLPKIKQFVKECPDFQAVRDDEGYPQLMKVESKIKPKGKPKNVQGKKAKGSGKARQGAEPKGAEKKTGGKEK